MDYLKSKMDIDSKQVLKTRLLSRCGQLDFGQLAKDVEPFILSKKNVKKVTNFPELIEAVQ